MDHLLPNGATAPPPQKKRGLGNDAQVKGGAKPFFPNRGFVPIASFSLGLFKLILFQSSSVGFPLGAFGFPVKVW